MRWNKIAFLGIAFAFIIISTYFTTARPNPVADGILRGPDLEPVPITIDITDPPPFIADIFEVSGTQPVAPIAGISVLFRTGFVVQDANGAGTITTTPTPGNDVSGGIQAPINSVVGGATPLGVGFTSCTNIDCSFSPGTCTNPPLQVIFICNGDFLYYYPPSLSTTNPNDLWRIGLQVKDTATGTWGPVGQSGTTLPPDPSNDFLQANTVSGFEIQAGSTFSWPALSITGTNQLAAAPVIINNRGNTPLPTTQINGADLTGVGNPAVTMAVSGFSIGGTTGSTPPAECAPTTSTSLQNGVPVTISSVSTPYTAIGSPPLPAPGDRANAYACARTTSITGSLGSTTQFTGTWQLTAS